MDRTQGLLARQTKTPTGMGWRFVRQFSEAGAESNHRHKDFQSSCRNFPRNGICAVRQRPLRRRFDLNAGIGFGGSSETGEGRHYFSAFSLCANSRIVFVNV
jgi:hypothetical protein